MYPSLLHKMAQFCMNTAKKSSGGRTPRPPSNKTLLDPIIHINTEKITIKTFKQLNSYITCQKSAKRYAKHRKPCPAPSTKPSH